MTDTTLSGKTLDDVMRALIEEVEAHGERVLATKGWNTEVTGILFEITDPRARLSRTESRGKPFSCLGELCWYLAKNNKLDFISYYLSRYEGSADGDEIFGGYGPRLFNLKGLNQVDSVTNLLKRKRTSRQAVIQVFDAFDIVAEHKDVPCTCTLQFMIRNDKLYMLVNMRSNDLIKGLPHDVFCFTMLQEIIARSLSVEVGTYKHAVGSLHIYDDDIKDAKQFIGEGWQLTEPTMPQMPAGDPWPAISLLVEAELAIRTRSPFEIARLNGIDPYWADLIRLLQVFRFKQDRSPQGIREVRSKMSSDVYFPFIDKALGRFK